MRILWQNPETGVLSDDRPDASAPRLVASSVNVLADAPEALDADLDRAGRGGVVMLWGGWWADAGTEASSPGTGDFQSDPRVWMPKGRSAFTDFITGAKARAEAAGVILAFRPHAATGLSDLPGCVGLWKTHGAGAICVAADPVGLLTVDMLRDAEDHLRRSGEVFAALESTAILVLRGGEPDEEGRLRACPLTRGAIPGGLIVRCARQALAREVPVVLIDEDRAGQRALLDEHAR